MREPWGALMRILVIDDSPTVGAAIRLRLEAGGAEVRYAESALAGITMSTIARSNASALSASMPASAVST